MSKLREIVFIVFNFLVSHVRWFYLYGTRERCRILSVPQSSRGPNLSLWFSNWMVFSLLLNWLEFLHFCRTSLSDDGSGAEYAVATEYAKSKHFLKNHFTYQWTFRHCYRKYHFRILSRQGIEKERINARRWCMSIPTPKCFQFLSRPPFWRPVFASKLVDPWTLSY